MERKTENNTDEIGLMIGWENIALVKVINKRILNNKLVHSFLFPVCGCGGVCVAAFVRV